MGVKLRKRRLKDGRISLYLELYYTGKTSYEFLKLYLSGDKKRDQETLHLAEIIRSKTEHELASEVYGVIPPFKRKIAFTGFFRQQAETKYNHLKNYRSCLAHLENFIGKRPIVLPAIDHDFVQRFQDYLKPKISPATVNHYLSMVRSVLNDAVNENLILKNPAIGIKPLKIVESERVYLTEQELMVLAETPCERRPQVRAAFLLSCFTGLRKSDLQALRWEQVKGDTLHLSQKKTGRFEYLPLSDGALALIERLKRGRAKEHVFPIKFYGGQFSKIFREWIHKAGINKRVTFHSARHTYATLLLSSGVDVYIVSELLGHRDIRTTQIYAQIISERKREAVKLFPKIMIKNEL